MNALSTIDLTVILAAVAGVLLTLVLIFILWLLFKSIYMFGHSHGYQSGVRRSDYELGVASSYKDKEKHSDPDSRIRGEPLLDELEGMHASSEHNTVFQTLDEEK